MGRIFVERQIGQASAVTPGPGLLSPVGARRGFRSFLLLQVGTLRAARDVMIYNDRAQQIVTVIVRKPLAIARDAVST